MRILATALNAALPLIILIALFTYSARGESYKIENILNIKTALPEGKGAFAGTNLPVNLGKGQVAFRAEGFEGQKGIYIYKDGVITRAVDGNTAIPGQRGKIGKIGNPVPLGGGDFAFIAENESGEPGIYEYRNGTVDVLLDNETANKPADIEFSGFRDLKPAGRDSLIFTADAGERGKALYLLNRAKLTLIASSETDMPGGKDKFEKLEEAVYLGGGAIAFKGRGKSGKSGIYIYSGTKLEAAVDTDTVLPGGEGKFKKFGNPVSIGKGDMVFTARSAKSAVGIYRYSDGKVTEVAGKNAVLSGKGDKAVTLRNISREPGILQNGDIVFQASGAKEVRGIYAAGKGGVRIIADTATPIPGGKGDFTKFVHSSALPGGGVAFKADGKDGQSGIYVSKGDNILLVADKSMNLPAGNGKFRYFGDVEPANLDNFLFFAEGYEAQIGLYEAVYGRK